MNKIEEFIERSKESESFCFDIEHDPTLDCNKSNFELHGCSFATEGIVFYERDYDVIKHIITTLFSTDIYAVAHNAKSDTKNLVAAKIITPYEYPENLVDTMGAENLLDDNLNPKQLALSKIVFSRYGHEMMEFKEAWGAGADVFEEYSCEDARFELKL